MLLLFFTTDYTVVHEHLDIRVAGNLDETNDTSKYKPEFRSKSSALFFLPRQSEGFCMNFSSGAALSLLVVSFSCIRDSLRTAKRNPPETTPQSLPKAE